MPAYKPGLYLLLLLYMVCFQARAQTGSLGDPVFNDTFGSGSTYKPVGPQLPFGTTNLFYTKDKCPGVNPNGTGQYCIAFTTGGCFDGTWRTINSNHTPNDIYGYMMIINASTQPDVFYKNEVQGSKMCAGARYQYQVWVYNLLAEAAGETGYQQPDIEFLATKRDGTPLSAFGNNTGPIPATGGWNAYSIDFVAPADGSDVLIALKDKTVGSDMGNDFAIDDVTIKPYGPVIDIGIGALAGPQEITTTQCVNDGAAKYDLKAFVHNYASPVYQWQSNINNAGWNNIAGKTQDHLDLETEFAGPAPGKYQYRLGALSGPGVPLTCQTFSEPITINVVKNPDIQLPAITPVCEGKILSIHADGGSDYYWTLPNGSHSDAHFLDVSLSANQTDQGIYKVVITGDGCTTTTQTQVVVYPPLIATVDDTGPTICEGEYIKLKANGGLTYKWTPSDGLDHDDIATPMASPSKTTEYNVAISNGGCTDTRTVTVNVLALPKANAGADLTIQEGQPVKLPGSASGTNVTYYWTPTDYMDDPTSLTPEISPPDNITYTLHVQSTDCGGVSDEMKVRVLKKLGIPSTFTPNGDGVNDTWHIDKLNTYPESTLTVYTRAGQEVFRTVGDAKQWNGVYAGKALPAGVYYYVIDLKNNLPLRSGWVMLLR
jgi:gliding motility-associated-like protein